MVAVFSRLKRIKKIQSSVAEKKKHLFFLLKDQQQPAAAVSDVEKQVKK